MVTCRIQMVTCRIQMVTWRNSRRVGFENLFLRECRVVPTVILKDSVAKRRHGASPKLVFDQPFYLKRFSKAYSFGSVGSYLPLSLKAS
jgi:hypothetical protein